MSPEEYTHYDRAVALIRKHIEQQRRRRRGTLRGQTVGNTDDSSWRRTLEFFEEKLRPKP